MRLPKWMWRVIRSKRIRIAALCSPFALGILGAGYYGWENVTGRRAAERCFAELEARGFETSLAKAVDRGISDEDNVFKHPRVIAELQTEDLSGLYGEKFSFPKARRSPAGRAPSGPTIVGYLPTARLDFAEVTSVVEWFDPPLGIPEEEVARMLLDDLAALVARGNALKEGFEMAGYQVDLGQADFEPGKAPRFAFAILSFKRLVEFYLDLAELRLAAGDVEKAHQEVCLVLEVGRSWLHEPPSGISAYLAWLWVRRTTDVIQEGVLRESWSKAQLWNLLDKLSAIHFEKTVRPVLELEVSYFTTSLQYELEGLRRERPPIEWTAGWEPDLEVIRTRIGEIWRQIRPVGSDWKEQVEAIRCLAAASREREHLTEERLRELEESDSEHLRSAASIIDSLFITGRARAETAVDLGRVGLAAELHRLEEGEYPEDLEALVPGYLEAVPEDPWVKNRPLGYERMTRGGIRVWSVGEDGVDEGGLPHYRWEQGDEVWLTKPIPGFTEADWKR